MESSRSACVLNLCCMILLAAIAGCARDSTSDPHATDATSAGDAGDAVPGSDCECSGIDIATDGGSDGGDALDSSADSAGSTDGDCDPLMPSRCGLPWPSNLYLKPDATRTTGYTLTFGATTLPANTGDTHVDPQPYTRLDGYGVGSSLLVQFPHVDITAMARQTSVDLSVQPTAAVVWLEVDATGKLLRRIPYFVELDQRANAPGDTLDPATQVLFVRPGVVLDYGKRYVVAFRNLKDTQGKAMPRSAAFQALLDGKATGKLAERQERFDEVFAILAQNGVPKDELTLAWDFVTESSGVLHDRILEMRDKSLAIVGDQGPEFTVTGVKVYTQDEKDGKDMAFDVTGTFHVPSFVTPHDMGDDVKAWRFHLDAQGKLQQDGWRDAKFWLRVPRSCVDGQNACDLLQYGHGLNGAGDEIFAHWAAPNANQRHLIYFSCNMIGMSEDDLGTILKLFNDMSEFPALPERVTQGLVEHVLLAQGMLKRGADLPPMKEHGVKLSGQVYYSGNSQGGIYGQTLLAINPLITRAHLGQPGIWYSMLLERSADFDDYLPFFTGTYPERVDQAIMLSVMQLQWDLVDPGTYVRHMEQEPFPNTPKHTALAVLHPGDFQVDPVTDEISVRSGYYKLMTHYGHPVAGVQEVGYPIETSGLVAIDFGNTWGQKGNVAAGEEPGLACAPAGLDGGQCLGKGLCDPKGTWEACTLKDPHDRAHGLKAHNDQMVHFFHTGEIKDFCGGDGCHPE